MVVCILLHAFGGQRTLVGVGPPTIQVLEIELWSSSIVASTFIPKKLPHQLNTNIAKGTVVTSCFHGKVSYEILIWYFQILIFRLHFLPEYYREDASFLSALSPLEDTWPPSVTGDTDFDQGHFSQSTI